MIKSVFESQAQLDGVIKWTYAQARRAEGEWCGSCDMLGVNTRAVVLAIVVGFNSDGGGCAHLRPVCERHARQHNVIPCIALPSDDGGE